MRLLNKTYDINIINSIIYIIISLVILYYFLKNKNIENFSFKKTFKKATKSVSNVASDAANQAKKQQRQQQMKQKKQPKKPQQKQND